MMKREDKVYWYQNLSLVGLALLASPWIGEAANYLKPTVEIQECKVYHVNAPRQDLRCEK